MDDDIAQLEQEQRRLQLLEQQLAEAQTRVNSEVEVMRLKLEEDNVKTAEYLDQQKAALESERKSAAAANSTAEALMTKQAGVLESLAEAQQAKKTAESAVQTATQERDAAR